MAKKGPDPQRDKDEKVYSLKNDKNMSFREVAEEMGISKGMAHRRYTRHKKYKQKSG